MLHYSYNNTNKLLRRYFSTFMLLSLLIWAPQLSAQINTSSKDSTKEMPNPRQSTKKWYESFSIRGYTQFRYNRLLETNPQLKCEQCDRSWGDKGGVFMRRMRVIIFGQISERIYIYVQPDFASSASSTGLHFAQIRDAYMDVGLDKNNEFRFRIGQSKVPFGFENMQSSQNRLALDRNDALNSAVSNERDMGVFFYWAPKKIRKLFSQLVAENYKGSGDYGVLGLGVYNGQTANRPEANNNMHVVGRLTYPFKVGKQIIEPSIQGYTGQFVVNSDNKAKMNATRNYLDQRFATTFVLYPNPFGLQFEYNIGTGPNYNKLTDSIEQTALEGGYLLLNYRINKFNQFFFPFVRLQQYKGGKKHELDARSYEVKEAEFGIEWQPYKTFELVVMYTISQRRFEDSGLKNNFQKGSLLRIQAQFNF